MKISLDDRQAEILRKLAAEPYTFSCAWAADGHKQVFFFANREGERLPVHCVAGLAFVELVALEDDPKDAEKLTAKATAEGVAFLARRKAGREIAA